MYEDLEEIVNLAAQPIPERKTAMTFHSNIKFNAIEQVRMV